MKHFFIEQIWHFLSFAAVHISYVHGDWVLVEFDGNFFAGGITHVINNQNQV